MPANKITLVHKKSNSSIGHLPWIKTRLQKDFDIIVYDEHSVYDPATHVIVVDRYDQDSDWHVQFQQNGFKLIVEYFWDTPKNQTPRTQDNVLELCAREWIWINDYLKSQYLAQTVPRVSTIVPDKFFLLLMNLRRDCRDQLLEKTKPYLDHSLYSYRARGIKLPGDYVDEQDPDKVNQDFHNHDWYNHTNFSLVSEAFPAGTISQDLYVSEKTFKPVKLGHAFVVYGSMGTLEYLHDLGFETFDHVIDESYDKLTNSFDRLKRITQVLEKLYEEFQQGKTLFDDHVSRDKIQHNVARFYDSQVIDRLWQTQVIDVINGFIND
jgi:hypothetical protein